MTTSEYTPIRFLPPVHRDPFRWVNRAAARELPQPTCDLPVRGKVMIPVMEVIGYTLPFIRPSRHRSARIWKKLVKRRRESVMPLYDRPTRMQVPASLLDKLGLSERLADENRTIY